MKKWSRVIFTLLLGSIFLNLIHLQKARGEFSVGQIEQFNQEWKMRINEDVALLLSLKYQINLDSLSYVLREYKKMSLTIPVPLRKKLGIPMVSEEDEKEISMSMFIDTMSKKFNISKKTLGAVLLDYKLLTEIEICSDPAY